jgi:hypothetical protein
MRDGYARLAELAARELELVEEGALDSLPQLWDERRAVVASLPTIPPPAARSALERAAELQGRVTALLHDRLAVTGADLSRLVRGRAAMHRYAPAGGERVPLVDRAG